ncbi:amidohydrolase [Roseobacter sp. EG26]|uniref:amidohydrolase n=1 Tax=Roseobacter sp. EG26 TaxID=3412477 RepID=UPI003CE477B5
MKKIIWSPVLFSTLVLFGVSAEAQNLVLTNAAVFTVNNTRDWAEAVAIDADGFIVAVGSETEVIAQAGPQADVVDLAGKMVLPGFQDIHVHAVEAGINAVLCPFEAFDDLEGHIASVTECAKNGETGPWVLGANVNMVNLLELHDNPVAVLDVVVPDKPVLILDDIGHGAWANSRALEAVGYDRAVDQNNGNIILRNAAGTPNGIVLENAPHNLRSAAFPPTQGNLDFAYDSLLDAAAELNRNGVTSVSDAGGYWPQGHHQVWNWAEDAGVLTLRASNAFYIYPDRSLDDQLSELRAIFHNDPDRRVRFNVAKIYVDGILSQATGALLEPYEKALALPTEEERGFLYFEKQALFRAARELSAAGFQLHFHVTGDYGTRLALDAIEQADPQSGPHRLTHIYLAHPSDYPRFAELDAIADLQLAPSALSAEYQNFIGAFIGDRVDRLLPAGALLDAGATVTLSSDWDADELNPMVKIAAAVGRENNGFPNVASAIEAMTINAAIALRHADRTGSIEVGKFADLVVLSDNILDMSVSEIATVTIEATLLQGEVVFDRVGQFER